MLPKETFTKDENMSGEAGPGGVFHFPFQPLSPLPHASCYFKTLAWGRGVAQMSILLYNCKSVYKGRRGSKLSQILST